MRTKSDSGCDRYLAQNTNVTRVCKILIFFINFIVNIVGKNIINSMGHNTGPSENQFF